MDSVVSELEWAARLSGHLKTLSELAESLTYRVLELEERLSEQDMQLTTLHMASDELTDGIARAMEEKMVETEERLARIEGLLQGSGQRGVTPRSLRALPNPSTPDPGDPRALNDVLYEDAGFLDEIHGEPGEMEDGEEDKFMEDPPFLEDLHEQSLAS